jgi:uncharacterized protein HemX
MMEKRTALVASILALSTLLSLGGTAYSMYRGQSERINVIQREAKQKDVEIKALGSQVTESKKLVEQQKKQLDDFRQKVDELQKKMDNQQKTVQEVQNKVNF